MEKCPIQLKSNFDWVYDYLNSEEAGKEDGEKKHCPPCLIAPMASMYLGVLEEAKEEKLISDLKIAYDTADLLTIAKELDKIRVKVGDDLRNKFEVIDCESQSFRLDKEEGGH